MGAGANGQDGRSRLGVDQELATGNENAPPGLAHALARCFIVWHAHQNRGSANVRGIAARF
jgi:hypothetical protein